MRLKQIQALAYPAQRGGQRSPLKGVVVLAMIMAATLLAPGSSPGAADARHAGDALSAVQEVRSIWTSEFGVDHPTGVAYLAGQGALVLAGPNGAGTQLVRLSMFEDRLGSSRAPELSRASTLAYDATRGRLTAVDTERVVTIAPTANARTDARQADAKALRLRNPRGATFDAATGAWFVLDGGGRAIVRVAPSGDLASATRLPLGTVDASRLRGLAHNPTDGLLYTLAPAQDALYAFDTSGALRDTYSVEELALQDPQAIVFAPSADPTDAPARQHLFIADAGSQTRNGRLVEATLAPALAVTAASTPQSSTLVQLIHTSSYSPASPDPAGITYSAATDRLIISDSEVDEMTIYAGSNLYTATRTGSGLGTGATMPWTSPQCREPSDVGLNPANQTLYVADDDRDAIYIFRPGLDGRHGTSDDVTSSFSTSAFGSLDAEGVEYDSDNGHLYVADGVGVEVYDIDPVDGVFGNGNDVVSHFDVAQYGGRDAEGIGFDPQRHTILVVDPSTKKLYELTKAGALARTIELGTIPTTNRLYADVTVAPSSDPNDAPTRLNYWIVDRQVDNGSDPNENDGKLYEVSAPPADGPPTVTVTSPAEGATVSGTVTVGAGASDDVGVAQVAFSVDGVKIGTDTNAADGWSASWNTATVADGSHTLTATATDTTGQTASDSNTFSVDNLDSPPSVSVSAPAEGATVSGTVTVQASASDDAAVSQVVFSVDGAALATDTNGADGWSASWDTTGVADGSHAVTATATDSAGQTASDSNTVTVHNADDAPSVTVTAPAEGSLVSGVVSVIASASDNVGVALVTFSVDGLPIGADTDGSDGWSLAWDTTLAGDGPHTVTATATDTAGQTASDSNDVSVDNTPPSVAVTSPTDGATLQATVSIQATASDNQAVAKVQFFADGVSIGTDTNAAGGWSTTWDTTTVPDGARSLSAVATDAAGHATTSAAVAVTVDNPDIAVLDFAVPTSNDDAEEAATGTVSRNQGDLELGQDGSVAQTVGLRFTGVTIPQGKTITRAYIQFQVDEKSRLAASLTVRAQLADDAAGFATTAFNLSSRPTTAASVLWNPPVWLVARAAGVDQRTPDLATLLQEVVNRSGWSSGNALVVFVTGTGTRTAESFEGLAPPVLHVEYAR